MLERKKKTTAKVVSDIWSCTECEIPGLSILLALGQGNQLFHRLGARVIPSFLEPETTQFRKLSLKIILVFSFTKIHDHVDTF